MIWHFITFARFCYIAISVICNGLLFLLIKYVINVQVASVLADRYFYGRWTSSVVNLVFYNVFSGDGSTLYGVEGPFFYFRNAFNNFNFIFVLALLSPSLLLLNKRKYSRLLVVISPIFVWLSFMSLQPHKEERCGLLFAIGFLFSLYVDCAVQGWGIWSFSLLSLLVSEVVG